VNPLGGGYGIWIDQSDDITVTGNQLNHEYTDGRVACGIRLTGAIGCVVSSNTLWDFGVSGFGGYGIYVSDSDSNVIIGNSIRIMDTHGIYLVGSDYNQIIGNQLLNCTGWGILLDNDSNNNTLSDNETMNNGGDAGIDDANCDGNDFSGGNKFRGLTFSDNGTTTMLPTLVLPFVEGKTYETDTSYPWGWNVTNPADWAATQGYLPLHVQQVLRVQVWAASGVAVGAGIGMYVEFLMNAGQENEAWNAEAIQVINSLSDTRNFGQWDIIKWTYTPTNDTDVGDLIGGDAFCAMVLFESNPDGHPDTDAIFYCLVIEYV